MGRITIGTGLDNTGFKKGYSQIVDGAKRLATSVGQNLSSISKSFQPTSAAITKQVALIDELKRKYESLARGETQPKELTELEASLKRAQSETNKLSSEFEKLAARKEDIESRKITISGAEFIDPAMQSELDQIVTRMDEISPKWEAAEQSAAHYQARISEIKTEPLGTDEAQNLASKIDYATQKLGEMKEKSSGTSDAIGKAVGSIGEFARNTAGHVGNAISSIGRLGQSAIGKVNNSISSISSKISGFLKRIQKDTGGLSKNFDTLFNRIKRLAASIFVFNLMRRAITEFKEYLGAALKQNRAFANSFGQVKANLATAFQPILQTIIPILSTLMSWLATATAYLVQFMAALSGKSIASLQNSAKAMDDLGDATSSAGKAAKKALAPFDELNQLTSAAAAGGAGAAAGIPLEFTTIKPDMSWIDEFVSKLKDINVDYEYFFDLGYKIADYMRRGLESIPWDFIQAWAVSFTTKLAAFLNGAVANKGLWSAIGSTLGQGINTILLVAYTWLTKFDFKNFGDSLAVGLNKMIATIDPILLGNTIAAKMMSMLNIAYGFLLGFNWDKFISFIKLGVNSMFGGIDWTRIKDTFLSLFNGVFDAAYRLITEIPWADYAANIFLTLLNIVYGIPWETVAKSFSEFFNTLFDAAYIAVTVFDWRKFGESIGDSINSFFFGINWNKAGQTVSNGITGALDGISAAIEKIDWKKIGEDVKTFLINIDWGGIIAGLAEVIGAVLGGMGALLSASIDQAITDIGDYFSEHIKKAGGNVALGLWNGILEGLGNIATWIKDNILTPFVNGFKAAFGISSPSKLMEELGEYLIEGLKVGISNLIQSVVDLFQSLWDDITVIWDAASKWFDDNVVKPIMEIFTPFWADVKSGFSALWEDIKSVWIAIKKWFDDNITKPISALFLKFWNDSTTGFTTLWTNIKSVWEKVAKWYDDIVVKPISDTFSGLWSSAETGFTKLRDKVKEIWQAMSGWFKTNVTDPILKVFEDVSTAIKKVVNGIIGIGNKMISGVETGINKMINAINKNLRIKIDPIYAFGQKIWDGMNVGPSIGTVSFPRIPELATGTVVPPNKEFAAILGDNTQEHEVVSPLSTIEQAVENVLARRGSNDRPTTVILEIDGRELGRITLPHINQEQSRIGMRMSNRAVLA